MSGRSVTEPHCSLASSSEADYQNLVSILSLVTDNLLFLNQRKREQISTKECSAREMRLHIMQAHYRASYRARPLYKSGFGCGQYYFRSLEWWLRIIKVET